MKKSGKITHVVTHSLFHRKHLPLQGVEFETDVILPLYKNLNKQSPSENRTNLWSA